jgi:hypothetical protein
MKVNELLGDFDIYTSSEEQTLLDKLDTKPKRYKDLEEHDQFIADSLIRKSLVTKIANQSDVYIRKNEQK